MQISAVRKYLEAVSNMTGSAAKAEDERVVRLAFVLLAKQADECASIIRRGSFREDAPVKRRHVIPFPVSGR